MAHLNFLPFNLNLFVKYVIKAAVSYMTVYFIFKPISLVDKFGAYIIIGHLFTVLGTLF